MPSVSSPADSSALMLDVKAVAQMLGCSSRHVYRLADAGQLPRPFKLGALVRWRRNEIESWIDGGCKAVRPVTAKGVSR